MMVAAYHVPRIAVNISFMFTLYMLAELSTTSVSSMPGNPESLIKESPGGSGQKQEAGAQAPGGGGVPRSLPP